MTLLEKINKLKIMIKKYILLTLFSSTYIPYIKIAEILLYMDIYTKTILELASSIPYTVRLSNPDISITKRTAVCGSSITEDLDIKNAKIEKIGLDVKACALGQASASIFAKNAIGLELKEVRNLRIQLNEFLKTGNFKVKTPFLPF